MESKKIGLYKKKINQQYQDFITNWKKKYTQFLDLKEKFEELRKVSQKNTNTSFQFSIHHFQHLIELYESEFLYNATSGSQIIKKNLENINTSVQVLSPETKTSIPKIEQGQSDFLEKVYKILNKYSLKLPNPPSISPSLQSQCQQGVYEIKPYQKVVSVLANPNINMNLLVYHDMGTGKTCSITLSILQLAKYYQQVPVSKKVPAVLILIQNTGNIPRYYAEYEKGCRDIDWDTNTFILSHSNGHWVFRSSTNPFKVFFEVYIQKMTVKHSISKWGDGKGSLPDVGAVFVDEAHNLFDTKWLNTTSNNYAKKYLQQIQQRKDLKIFFFTGTPVADSDSFNNLAELLDVMVKYTSINTNVNYWFDNKSNGSWVWKNGKKMEMIQKLQRSISYFTLEHDPTVYPRLHIDFKIYSNINSSEGMEFYYDFQKNRFERKIKKISQPYVFIDVPSKPKNLKTGFSFKSYKQSPVPSKWLAVQNLLLQNRQKKHFLFMAAKTSTLCGMKDFTIFFQKYNSIHIEKLNWKQIDKLKFSKQNQQMEIDNFYKKWTQKERYCILETKNSTYGEVTPERLLKFQMLYNDEKNTYGNYIRYVFSTQDFKEGIDLYSTQMVHFLEPVSSTSIFDQAIRRVARYCSMRYLPNVYKDWVNSVIVYYASDIDKEKEDVQKLQSNKKSPVELTLEVMKSSAIDCQYFYNVTKVHCQSFHKKKESNVEYCIDPTGSQDVIRAKSRNQCYHKFGIPSLLGDYNIWDEILYQLLTISNYKPEKLSVTTWERFIHFFYATWFKKNEIHLSQKVPIQIIFDKILNSPRKYGNSILYLLYRKRKNVSNENHLFNKEQASIIVKEIIESKTIERILKISCIRIEGLNQKMKEINLEVLQHDLKKLKQYYEQLKLQKKVSLNKFEELGLLQNKTIVVKNKVVPKKIQNKISSQNRLVPKKKQEIVLKQTQKQNEVFLKQFALELKNRNNKQNNKASPCLEYFGLGANATKKELRKKYYKLALKYHPDKALNDTKAQQKFKELDKIYKNCLKKL